MQRVHRNTFRLLSLPGALLASLLGGAITLPVVVSADAGHDAKPVAEMPGMDHSKPGAMDHSQMGGANMDGHWMAPSGAAQRKNPVRANKASIARGKKLYGANCASCHGATGAGNGPAGKTLTPKPTELATMAPQHPPGDLAWKIENGRGAMPAWKGTLKPNQIWDLVNYLQNMTPAKGQKARAEHANDGHAH